LLSASTVIVAGWTFSSGQFPPSDASGWDHVASGPLCVNVPHGVACCLIQSNWNDWGSAPLIVTLYVVVGRSNTAWMEDIEGGWPAETAIPATTVNQRPIPAMARTRMRKGANCNPLSLC
jgi:hypothetical protein